MILILGATGNIGAELTEQLLVEGRRPRIGVRNPDSARRRFHDQVEYVPFDFHDFTTFPAAFQGVESFFFIAPHDDPIPSTQALLRAAAEARVQHVTFSSGRTTGDLSNRPLHGVENTVRAHGLGWTILRPGWFMQNFTGWIGATIPQEGKFYLPAGDAKTAFIDVRDIAAVALRTLTDRRHENEIYNLTSDEAFDHYEVAAMMSRAAGRVIEYVDLDPEEYVRWAVSRGWPEEDARVTVFLFDQVKSGKEEKVSPDVQRVLGHPPKRLADFIADHATFWKGKE